MNQFCASLGFWMEMPWTERDGSTQNSVKILLYRNSLAFGYLCFFEFDTPIAAFEIDTCVSSTVLDDKILIINQYYDFNTVPIATKSIAQAHMLNTQIALCSCLSQHSKIRFKENNVSFLMEYGKLMNSIPCCPNIIPMLPFTLTDRSYRTWERRCTFLNAPFTHDVRDLTTKFVTWNVQQRNPGSDLDVDFVFEGESDAIVITLEEIDFGLWALVVGSSSQTSVWSDIFEKAGAKFGYEGAAERSLGGVFLKIMKKKECHVNIATKIIDDVRLGASGFACNKSAVLAEVCVGLTRIGIIGAHLMAHTENCSQRAAQTKYLLNLMHGFDYTVLVGDLNFRIEGEYDAVVESVARGDLEKLTESDQLLNLLKNESSPLHVLHEEPLTFNPTFCFDPGTNRYDTSEKHRVPAWTDRVLVKISKTRKMIAPTNETVFETDRLKMLAFDEDAYKRSDESLFRHFVELPKPENIFYKSYGDIMFSDHRPVAAAYKFKVAVPNEARANELAELMTQKLDEFTQISMPELQTSDNILNIREKDVVVITNTSKVIAKWKVEVVPESVKLNLYSGLLLPMESVDLKVTVEDPTSTDLIIVILLDGGSPLVIEINNTDL